MMAAGNWNDDGFPSTSTPISSVERSIDLERMFTMYRGEGQSTFINKLSIRGAPSSDGRRFFFVKVELNQLVAESSPSSSG